MTPTAETALLAAAGVHAGFSLTVTTLVYPALFRAEEWHPAHAAHSRAIIPVVAAIYTALVAASALVLLDGVESAATAAALAGIVLSLTTTAFVAAPTHGRLARGRDERLLRRLRNADLVRTVGAFLALVGAVLSTG